MAQFIKYILQSLLAMALCGMFSYVEALEINVHNAPIQETVLALSKTYGMDILGLETLKGTITAHVHGDSALSLLQQLGQQQHFSVWQEGKTIVVDGHGMDSDKALTSFLVLHPQFARPEAVKKALAGLVDDKQIQILPDTNQVLVMCDNRQKTLIQSMWSDIDKEPQQVHLETSIIAFESSYAKEIGFNWSWLSLTGSGSDSTHSYGALQFGHTPSGETYKFFVKPELSAMETSGKAVLIARPSIVTINGEEAKILIGDRVPVLEETLDNGERSTHVRYEDVGIKLAVTPYISDDGAVDASIHAEVSSPALVSELKAYKITAREAKTRVRLQAGETLVIGGLMDNREGRQYKKIPILGDIPLLGKLFRHSQKTKDSVEMVMLVKANVVPKYDQGILTHEHSTSMQKTVEALSTGATVS